MLILSEPLVKIFERLPRADPGFILVGGAPLTNGVTDWWPDDTTYIYIFLQPVALESRSISGLGGGGAHPPHPPPRSAPDFVIMSVWMKIDTGTHNVTDVRGQSISKGVRNGITFANFKAHKFSYLNITSLGTYYVLNGKQCGFACVNIPSCFSFNLAAFYDIDGRILWELLQSEEYNNSDKFITSQLFHHFSIGVNT